MKLCLYGAGNTGKSFCDNIKNLYIGKYSDIYFTDENKELVGTLISGYEVMDMEAVDDETEIIITSVFFNEIYALCCRKGFNILGIYDKKTNGIYTYKDMCRIKKCRYDNDRYIKYRHQKEQKVNAGVERFRHTGNLFESISEVAIMLSNLCNYSSLHKLCPACCAKNKEILPSKIVYKILDELKDAGFNGTICFHIYNEPLIDPRLFLFIQYIKQNIMDAKVEVYSNGFYLNEQMVLELQDIGVDILIVTGYGDTEYLRLMDLPVEMAYSVLYGNLDQRLNLYENRENAINNMPCKTYFTQVSIYSNGEIGTCCLDYKHTYSLANIYEKSLEDSLNGERILKIQKELLNGNRTILPLCKNCNWMR